LNGKKDDLGIVQIWNLDDIGDQCLILRAHSSTLGIMELNYDGSLLATASEKGTLIRIFSTKTGDLFQEVRRGTENVVLFSVNFHFQDDWLACISDSGTLHIFNLVK
jgi:WD repeat-containing protein 45